MKHLKPGTLRYWLHINAPNIAGWYIALSLIAAIAVAAFGEPT